MTVPSQRHPEMLFHFTHSLDILSAILRDLSFRPSYAREKIDFGDQTRSFGVPMVSFCDLRLSECKEHADSYGHFGIGLSKSWATEKGLNPVIYLNSKSRLCQHLFPALETFFASLQGISDPDAFMAQERAYMHLFEFVRYGKNYEGMLKRRHEALPHHYRFANEREWRYVPHKDEATPVVPGTALDDPNNKTKLNNRASTVRLMFDAHDVRYLMVDSETSRQSLIGFIDAYQNGWSPEERRRLGARILTMEQVKSDF